MLCLMLHGAGCPSQIIHFDEIRDYLNRHPGARALLHTPSVQVKASDTIPHAMKELLSSPEARTQFLGLLMVFLQEHTDVQLEYIIDQFLASHASESPALSKQYLQELMALLLDENRQLPSAFETFLREYTTRGLWFIEPVT